MKMKKRNFIKLFVIAVALAALLTLFTVAVSAAEPSDLDIYGKNLSFDNEVHIFYAVKSADPSIKLHIWTEGTLGGEPTVLEPIFGQDVEGTVCTVFKFTGINAKQMTDNIYAQAVITDSETETCGKMSKYSILQYAYNKLGKTGTASTDEKLKALLVGMLDYGALAQDKFGYKADRPANADWVQVKLTGGTLPDGFGYGLYLPGDVVSITAPETLDGAAFLHWQDESETVIATTPVHDLTVGNVNQTYTAKYGANIAYSEGLAFTSNGDGTCYVSGIGTCTDTDIRIPTVSPEGDKVTSIGNEAFSYCSNLTSITIPASVTSIGDYALRYCGSLETVTFAEGSQLKSIGWNAFKGCSSLIGITIPDSVTSIGSYVFEGCSGLENIAVETGNTVYHSADNCLIETETNTLILGCKNSVIPAYVTSIGSNAFHSCSSLTSITIPDSVTSIGSYAFEDCSSLETVIFAEGSQLTSIGSSAFSNCSSLTSITIPDSVTRISSSAFYDCSSLNAVYITDIAAWCGIDFKSNGANPLYCAKNLYLNGTLVTDLVIPDSVTSIGSYAFYKCSSLTSITIPESVTSIGSHAFGGCSSLETVTFAEGSQLTSIGSSAFSGCSSLTSITVPDSVTSIGNSAFYNCSGNLISITVETGNTVYHSADNCLIETATNTLILGCQNSIIPAYITSIGSYAFYHCSSLTSITIPAGVTRIVDYAFSSCSSLETVTFAEGSQLTSIGARAFHSCSSLTSITIPDSVTSIGSSAFSGCSSNLISITVETGNIVYHSADNCLIETATNTLILGCKNSVIPAYVTSIGEDAFRDCSSLTSITIPAGVTSIGSYAFDDCSSLETVTFAEGSQLTSIGSSAFYNCSSLTSITIPAGVTSIGDDAFYNCSQLIQQENGVQYVDKWVIDCETSGTSVDLRNNTVGIGCRAFYYCSSLTSITIPASVTSIGSSAFWGCSSLTSITIPAWVTSIGDSAFRDCSSLTSITIPDSVTSIGSSAFYGCSSLTSITIPASVTSIGEWAFYDCSSLETVTFAEGSQLTSIGARAFHSCSSLTSITIPASVTSIGSYAFYKCSSLTSITFEGTMEQWNAITKGSNWNYSTGSYVIHCTDGDIAK